MKLRLLIMTLALAAVFAFTACGGSQDAKVSSVPESSGTKSGTEEVSKEEPESDSEEGSAEEKEAASAESSESSESSEEQGTAAETAASVPAGRYNLVGMVQDGETIATEDLVTMEELGFEMFLELKDDGTGEISLYGDTMEITWDDREITSDGETIPYEWDGRYLTLEQEGTSITFSTMTAQEVIDAGEGVEGTISFFEGDDDEDFSTEPTAEVKIVGADWVKNYEDKDILVVWFDMTNISDDYIYASWDAYSTVTQDGREVEYGFVDSDDVPETENVYRSVRPGVTVRCANSYEADKNGGIIEYKVTSGIYDAEILTEELDPSDLPGPPADTFELARIDSIDWLDGAVESGTYGDTAEVAFRDFEIIEGVNGAKLLRVWISYTNIGDEAASFLMAASIRAVQDGISLDTGYTSLDDENADLNSRDVEPGDSLDVCMDYELISDSPVAVEFVDYDDELIAKVFDVK